MPYLWRSPSDGTAELELWPFRSLPRKGFAIFIGLTAAFVSLPLLALLGSVMLWVILPFLAAAVAAIWWALGRSYRNGELRETLTITADLIDLTRRDPRGATQRWQANPQWTTVHLHPTGGPVPDYLTLRGNGREVELGAFLTAQERRVLWSELRARLKPRAWPSPASTSRAAP